MAYNFGEIVSPLGFGLDLDDLLKTGRVASVLCRLARDAFTGVLYVEHPQEGGGIFSFRAGHPVFVEDLGDGLSLPDEMLEQGLISKAQYAQIAERVGDALVESEDVAFCKLVVELGVLPQTRVDALVKQRNRARLIQAVSWEGCDMELDDDPDGLAGIMEYPEDVGSMVYMGVRTFFDEDHARAVLGAGSEYMRLTVAEPAVVGFFGLEPEEVRLLRSLRPDVTIEGVIGASDQDPLEVVQLIAMLALAGMAELAATPFEAPSESSGMRDARAITGGATRYSGAAVVEERVAQPRPAAQREATPAPVAERGGFAAREQAGPAQRAPSRDASGGVTSGSARAMSAGVEVDRTAVAEPRAPVAQPTPAQPERRDSVAARMRAKRRGPRKLGAALKRLDRELKERRAPSVPEPVKAQPARRPESRETREPAPPERVPEAAPGGERRKADRAHVKALMRMRQAQKTSALHSRKVNTEVSPQEDPEGAFRQAESALRDQQFDKAHEILKKLVAADEGHVRNQTFMLWARFRAKRASEDDNKELRKLLRDWTNDDLYQGFAAYALGHLALADKREDQAEKYFRKAVERDASNKDAERHLRILELKKKTAEQEKASNKIFGIEISRKKS